MNAVVSCGQRCVTRGTSRGVAAEAQSVALDGDLALSQSIEDAQTEIERRGETLRSAAAEGDVADVSAVELAELLLGAAVRNKAREAQLAGRFVHVEGEIGDAGRLERHRAAQFGDVRGHTVGNRRAGGRAGQGNLVAAERDLSLLELEQRLEQRQGVGLEICRVA